MLWYRVVFESNRKETSCLPLLNAGFEPRVSDTKLPADWMPADKPTELSKIKLKTWTRQPIPMISEHTSHSTPLPVGFYTWLWWYTCLLLILMLWHRQAIFKSKGDKLYFSAECRIRTQGLRHQITADWMPADKPTFLKQWSKSSTIYMCVIE